MGSNRQEGMPSSVILSNSRLAGGAAWADNSIFRPRARAIHMHLQAGRFEVCLKKLEIRPILCNQTMLSSHPES